MGPFPEVDRRALARFETPAALAEFLADQVHRRGEGRPGLLLDPTCGSGALLGPAAARGAIVLGVDLDPAIAAVAARSLGTPVGGRVKVGNALLDPLGPGLWPAFVADQRDFLDRVARLRTAGRFDAADRLARPVRALLSDRLPEVLRGQGAFCWPLEFPEAFVGDRCGGFDAVITNPPWDKVKLHVRECFDPSLRHRHESEQRDIRARRLGSPALAAAVTWQRRTTATFRAFLRHSYGASRHGDTNSYLCVLTLAHALLRPGGVLGAVVPGGFWTDASARDWRERLFSDYDDIATWGLEARTPAFPAIDQRTALLCARRRTEGRPRARSIAVSFGREGWGGRGLACNVPISHIRRTAPGSAAIPAVVGPADLALIERLYEAGPPFAAGPWQPEFGREIDMSTDSALFDGMASGAPLWEGKRIGAFELCPVDAVRTGAWPRCEPACTRGATCPYRRRNGQQLWVDPARLPARRDASRYSRVAWRSVARADRARRLEAALIPAGYYLGNSLNYLAGDRHSLPEKLTLLALLNSLVVEWRFRQLSANNNVNLFVVRQLPVPGGVIADLVAMAGALMLSDSRFAAEAAALGITGEHDPTGRRDVRLRLEARVARRFGLSRTELARILAAFPKMNGDDADSILAEFGG